MSRHAPDSLETRIQRWMDTGGDEHGLLLEIDGVVERHRHRLYAKFGEHVAADVVGEGTDKAWKAIEAGLYDPTQSFNRWLGAVLANACRDARRKARRRPPPLSQFTGDESGGVGPEPVTPDDHVETVDLDEVGAQWIEELERLLKPESRVVFVVAYGIADHIDRPVLVQWCRECDRGDSFIDAIDAVIALPIHGRQARLAEVLDLRDFTLRKRLGRAAETLAGSTVIGSLRELILGRSRAAD